MVFASDNIVTLTKECCQAVGGVFWMVSRLSIEESMCYILAADSSVSVVLWDKCRCVHYYHLQGQNPKSDCL